LLNRDPMPGLIRVAVPVPLPQTFDYELPAGPLPEAGCRVLVPFGPREVVGIVIGPAADPGIAVGAIKPVSCVLDAAPLLTAELLDSLRWAARYYQHPIGEVCAAALPLALRSAQDLPEAGHPGIVLNAHGVAALGDPRRRRGTRIDAVLQALADGPLAVVVLDERVPGWRASATELRRRGWIDAQTIVGHAQRREPVPGPKLNPEQEDAARQIVATHSQFAAFVLDGVTGSGKTEVYLAAIADAIARGRQSLVLVPEIALTPQTTRRFRERLGIDIAILHSGLAEGARARAWLAAARGEAMVVLGTRSAIFTPLPKAGLLIVDEEHDTSYKQQDGFRYHARDLAVVRARALGIPVVLGSATPSLETLANIEAGRYHALRLTRRAGVAKPPRLRVMDVRRKRLEHGLAIETLDAIAACLAAGEQVLVFRNRRGYAPVLFCQACGWSAQCARCDRPLTVHRGIGRLRCHHCGADAPIPRACPTCSSPALAPQGQGTERLEETLSARFADVPVIRVDRDSTRGKARRDAILEDFSAPGPRILVGTQILAKGHDLPDLTLVVVVGVDEGLYSVDFRAPERLGQLIVQVAGRAGRAERPGTVILQTHHPDHPLLGALLAGGYHALAARLLEERRSAPLPPFAQFALLRAEAKSSAEAQAFLDAAAGLSRAAAPAVQVHGPMPAPMPRRAGFQRLQLLAEAADRAALQRFLPDWLSGVRALREARRVRWSIDVDPVEMG